MEDANSRSIVTAINSLGDKLIESMTYGRRGGSRRGGGGGGDPVTELEDELGPLVKQFKEIRAQTKKENDARQELIKKSKAYSIEVANARIALMELKKQVGANTAQYKEAAVELEHLEKAAERARERSGELGEGFKLLKSHSNRVSGEFLGLANSLLSTASVVGGFKKAFEEANYAMSKGASYDFGWQAAKMGMGAKDLIDMQTQFRQVALAHKTGVAGLTQEIADQQVSLRNYTGSMKDAAFLLGDVHDVSQSMGVGVGKISENAIPSLIDSFKTLQQNTGLTATEFGKLAKDLVNDEDIRSNLMRISEDQRESYALGMIKQTEYYTTLGYTTEQAAALTKQMAKMQAETPIERLKRGMKMRALGGVIGADSADTEEIARIDRLGMKATQEERIRKDQLTAKVASQHQAFMGQSFGHETIGSYVGEKLGLTDTLRAGNRDMMLGKNQAYAGIGADQSSFGKDFPATTQFFASAVDRFSSAIDSAIWMIGAGAAVMLGGRLIGAGATMAGAGTAVAGAGTAVSGAAAAAAAAALANPLGLALVTGMAATGLAAYMWRNEEELHAERMSNIEEQATEQKQTMTDPIATGIVDQTASLAALMEQNRHDKSELQDVNDMMNLSKIWGPGTVSTAAMSQAQEAGLNLDPKQLAQMHMDRSGGRKSYAESMDDVMEGRAQFSGSELTSLLDDQYTKKQQELKDNEQKEKDLKAKTKENIQYLNAEKGSPDVVKAIRDQTDVLKKAQEDATWRGWDEKMGLPDWI